VRFGRDLSFIPRIASGTAMWCNARCLVAATVLPPLGLTRYPRALDVAVFFEFKHYKPKKAKVSTRCYSFMELDEMQSCSAPLEL